MHRPDALAREEGGRGVRRGEEPDVRRESRRRARRALGQERQAQPRRPHLRGDLRDEREQPSGGLRTRGCRGCRLSAGGRRRGGASRARVVVRELERRGEEDQAFVRGDVARGDEAPAAETRGASDTHAGRDPAVTLELRARRTRRAGKGGQRVTVTTGGVEVAILGFGGARRERTTNERRGVGRPPTHDAKEASMARSIAASGDDAGSGPASAATNPRREAANAPRAARSAGRAAGDNICERRRAKRATSRDETPEIRLGAPVSVGPRRRLRSSGRTRTRTRRRHGPRAFSDFGPDRRPGSGRP